MNDTIVDFYKSEDCYRLYQYFFDLFVSAFTDGIATNNFEECRRKLPNLVADDNTSITTFLMEGTSLLGECYAPKLFSLLLEHQYSECLKNDTTKSQEHMMNLSRYLIECIHTFDIETLLETKILWSTDIKTYAELSFFPRLPKDLQEKWT